MGVRAMKRLLGSVLVSTCLLCSIIVDAAAAYRLAGRVYDKNTGDPLVGANVIIEDLKLGLPTDEGGRFAFPAVPGGTHVLSVSYVGYKVAKKSFVLRGDMGDLDFPLESTIIPGEKIVVTATRARSRYSPATFSNLSSDELKERYTTQDIPVLLSELPSSSFYSESGNGIGYNYLTLRGFDQRRISVMINGIPQNDPEDHNVYWVDFPDLAANLQDVQVQRGAGSSFYGPPAIGGSVNLVTSIFAPVPGARVTMGYGSFNTQKYSLELNSGLINNSYAFYGRFSKILTQGYRNDSWVDYLSYFFGAAKYTENTTTKINLYGGPIKDHLAYYGIPKSFLADREKRKTNWLSSDPEVKEQIENFFQPHYELMNTWKLSEDLILNNAFFYVQGDGFFDFDGSWADTTYYRLTNEYGFNPTGNPGKSLIRAFVGNKQGGWLPRLTVKHGPGELNVGAELRYHQSLHWGSVKWAQNLPAGVSSDRHYYEYKGAKTIASGYVDEVYRIGGKTSVKASLQSVYNRYRIFDEKFVGNDFSVSYLFWNPRLGVNVNFTDAMNAYLSFSRTKREPRLKNLYDAAESSGGAVPEFAETSPGVYDFDNPFVKPEVLNDFEFGAGYSRKRFSAVLNVFYMDFKDEIVKKGGLDRFGQPVTGNAEKTSHKGVELSLGLEPLGGLRLKGNVSYSRNRLDRYTLYDKAGKYVKNPSDPNAIVAYALDGNRIAGFPDLIWNARVDYERPLNERAGIGISLWAHYEGDKYTDNFEGRWYSGEPRPERVVDAYTVLNGSLSLSLKRWGEINDIKIILQVFNITDELYANNGEGDDFFPAATRNFYAGVEFGM